VIRQIIFLVNMLRLLAEAEREEAAA